MAIFQASYGSNGNANYQIEAPDYGNKLEAFLWKLLLVSALAYFVWSDTIRIGLGPVFVEKTSMQRHLAQRKIDLFGFLGFSNGTRSQILLEEGDMNNLTFILDRSYAQRFDIPDEQVQRSLQRCSLFVKRFSPVAIAEMRRYGVPASIMLAQALLASDAGDDPISRETNNFFIRPCQPGFCNSTHFSDLNSDADQVVEVDEYPNLWGSFRAQSLFFRQSEPFSGLFQLEKTDYISWAFGIESAGYSTDAQYADKLIAIIQGLQLETFDAR